MSDCPIRSSSFRAWACALLTAGAISSISCNVLDPLKPPYSPLGPGGRVQGSLYVLTLTGEDPGQRILVPDVAVTLRREPGGEVVAKTETDLDGRYHFRRQPPGTYRLCWDGPGYFAECRLDLIVLQNGTRYPISTEIRPKASAGAAPALLHGRVKLRDGAARYFEPLLGIDEQTRLELIDGQGHPAAPEVRANNLGQFVFAGIPPTAQLTVRGHYAGTTAEAPAAPAMVLEFANRPPDVVSVVAFDDTDRGVRHAAPGQTLELRVRATDGDGDPLRYEWRRTGPGGALSAGDSATAKWTVPKYRGQHSVHVLVSDGKGGYDLGRVTVQVGAESAFFAGRVAGTDGPSVAGATVRVNAHETATDANGAFNLAVSLSNRYLLTIEKPGYVPVSRLSDVAVSGRLYRMVKADTLTVDPKKDIVIDQPDRRECVDFDELDTRTQYRVGDRFRDSGATATIRAFLPARDPAVTSGFARGDDRQRAGGSGHDLAFNNVTAAFTVPRPLSNPTLRYGHFGGSVSLEINGEAVYAKGFAELDGRRIGGVRLAVGEGQVGLLRFTGTVRTLAVGGQELWMDDLCGTKRLPHLTIPAGSLVDAGGAEPSGTLELSLAVIEPGSGEVPGDWGALDSGGTEVNLLSYGMSFVELRDATGKLYNLAKGATADLSMPVASNQLARGAPLPAEIPMWTYDMETGFWAEEAEGAKLDGDRYRTRAGHFSFKNTDLKLKDATCLAVTLDPTLDGGAKELRVTIVTGSYAGQVFQFALDAENPHGIYRLPANETISLEPLDAEGNVITAGSKEISSGPPVAELWPLSPYEPCNDVTLGIEVPDWAGFPGSLFLTFENKFGFGSEAETNAYYATVDPQPLRQTLGAWWLVNGFGNDGSGGTRTAYFNNNDLALGRDMHCLANGGDLACYVSNYADADEAYGPGGVPDKSLSPTTVTMEYSQIEGVVGPRIVKFFVYDGAEAGSPIRVSANLDGFGEKFVPQLCLVCHGGTYDPQDPLNPTPLEVDLGSSFREFDLGEPGPDAVEIFTFPAAAPKAAQEADFKTLNLLVRDSDAARQPIKDLITRWYDDGVVDNSPVRLPDVAPNDWNAAPQADLYLDVVAVSCRTCHIAQEQDDEFTEIDWNHYAPWVAERGSIDFFVCSSKVMPHALATYNKLWLDTVPVHRPSALANFEDLPDWPAFGTCP